MGVKVSTALFIPLCFVPDRSPTLQEANNKTATHKVAVASCIGNSLRVAKAKAFAAAA